MKKKISKKKKRKLSIYKIVGLILLLVSLIVCFFIKKLDILPTRYFALVLVGIFIINVPIDLFLFRKKTKKYKKNIALFFALLFIFLLFIPMKYMGKTIDFMQGIGVTDYKLENYSLVVLKNSSYDKLDDIKELSVGVYENTDGIKKAKDKLLDNVDVTFENYDNLENISQDLIAEKIGVILLEDSILSMIKEDNPEFEQIIKTIYTFSIKIKSDNDAKEVNVITEPFNIYITGIDTFGDISSVSRSDVNIVMTVNPKTKQILLTSIPRDYYVPLHGKNGSKDKLTHAGIYGTDMSITTIEDLLGIDINYYIKVNFSSFIDIINSLGKIDVYSEYSFTSIDGYKYNEGLNKLNGEEALSFARERKAFTDGDRQRGADQQAVIEAVIKKMCNKSILTKYESLLKSIEGKFQTNMSNKEITSLIKMQINDMSSWNIISIGLDGSNGRGITYSGGNQELYVMIPDWNTVDEASSTIKAVLDGQKIDESFKPDKNNSTRVIKSYNTAIVNNKNNDNNKDNSDNLNNENNKKEENEEKKELVEKKVIEEENEIESQNEKEIEINIDVSKQKLDDNEENKLKSDDDIIQKSEDNKIVDNVDKSINSSEKEDEFNDLNNSDEA